MIVAGTNVPVYLFVSCENRTAGTHSKLLADAPSELMGGVQSELLADTQSGLLADAHNFELIQLWLHH